MYAISQEQFVHLSSNGTSSSSSTSSSDASSGNVPLVMIESFSGGQHPHPHNPVMPPHQGAAPGKEWELDEDEDKGRRREVYESPTRACRKS